MWDVLVYLLFENLPKEVSLRLEDHLSVLESGDFASILKGDKAQRLFGLQDGDHFDARKPGDHQSWTDLVSQRLEANLAQSATGEQTSHTADIYTYVLLGYTALLCFHQSNCTGPPLSFSPGDTLFGAGSSKDKAKLSAIRTTLVTNLGVDGVAAYRLTPNVELLSLANAIFNDSVIQEAVPLTAWLRLRTLFTHQRILSEPSSTLQEQLFQCLDQAQDLLSSQNSESSSDARNALLLERASIETYYGNDVKARAAIQQAAQERHFVFALTGRLGKRTKFQIKDTSQLVVLAKSQEASSPSNKGPSGPKNLDLNDDTLLEGISFTKSSEPAGVVQDSEIPASLADIDPSEQPLLDPRDSIILLSLASTITNTSPEDGLTREETLPYATRVLDGGSSNWQVYTQALLVRSRCEGFKSRTVERGLLQLQALVDQVILDTTPTDTNEADGAESEPTSFLPKAKDGESAPVTERLRYVFQLGSPLRWELEAELAQRWVQLGGLRSALEIYERLEMWAEAALCWAATEREDKAKRVVRRLLYHATNGEEAANDDEAEAWEGKERDPLPADAPRLFCILGDIDQDASMYERAWEVSGQRYARAQRSLGRMYFTNRDYLRAAAAYSRSLHVNRLNHGTWFALACAYLELQEYERAVEGFTRCVQLDERDAEAWSNLAAALLRRPEQTVSVLPKTPAEDEEDMGDDGPKVDPQKSKQEALRALKRAAGLKHDSYQIWDNVLTVAASLDPPDYASAISAQSRVVDLRGPTVGENCVDAQLLTVLVRGIIAGSEQYDASKPGPERMLVDLFDRKIQPLITASTALWSLVARLAVWRKKPATALDAHEKGWRAVTTQPGWETDSEARWNAVVDATVDLCDAYESLGPMVTTEGLGAGEALVAKDWKFKSRSAVRGILGRGKASFEDTDGWTRLQQVMEGLRS